MDFVDTRAVFLGQELRDIEEEKQKFKELNDLSDIKENATININQKLTYDANLFSVKSQINLLSILEETINPLDYKLMPLNIGLESS